MTSIQTSRQVKIKQGEIRGTLEKLLSDRTYVSFKGIPYAKPPIGNLRFKSPQPPDNWLDVRDASKHGMSCPQQFHENDPFKVECSEDCLYLNVYTTSLIGSKAPVMVWFHGGAFLFGSGNSELYGPEFLLEEDVVIVTANYRLEAFGFLCLDTPDVPGNAGMKDQVAVLRWVKENIAIFGGDPENVTIFGESAGAASVTLHMFSPMSEGLFHKVIAQSGCCLNEWSLSRGKDIGLEVAKVFEKDTQDIEELTEYLKSVSTNKLVGVTTRMMKPEENSRGLKIMLRPTVEKVFDNQEAFLLKTPLELIAEGKFQKVPLILGYCDKEGLLLTRNVKKTTEKILESLKYRLPESICELAESNELKQLEEKIKKFYFDDTTTKDEMLSALADLESDVSFSYHVMHFSRLISKHTKYPIYFYKFCIDGTLNIPKIAMGLGDRKGACHTDDLFYLFNNRIDVPKESMEWKTIQRLCKMWTNFAKFSNPTPQKENLIQVSWKPLTESKLNYLNIDRELTEEINPDKKRFEFWDEIYKSFDLLSIKNL